MINDSLFTRSLAMLTYASVGNKLANLFDNMDEAISTTSISTMSISAYSMIEVVVGRSVSCNPIADKVFKFTCHAEST